MPNRICILADIRAITKQNGVLEVYAIDSDGIESGEPISTEPTPDSERDRWYACNNCGAQSPGTDEFTMKEHMGRFHELMHPFGYP